MVYSFSRAKINMRLTQVPRAVAVLLFCIMNFSLGSADDELYKKFYQTDYKVTLEREVVTYRNESVLDLQHNRFKYNRTQFVTNASLLFYVDVGNDVEIVVQAYKFLSNEYRIFPLHFQYNLCKAFKYDFAGLQSCINSCGYAACPFKKDTRYYMCNCIIDESRFPPFMPTGRFKFCFEVEYKNQVIAKLESYMTVYRPILPGKRYG